MLIGDIIRFGLANKNLSNALLVQYPIDKVENLANGKTNINFYSEYYFNEYGRLETIKSFDNGECSRTVLLIWDSDSLSAIHSRSYTDAYASDVLYTIYYNPLSLGGVMEVRSNGRVHPYSIFNQEDRYQITDGYDSMYIVMDQYGRICKFIDSEGSSESYSYNKEGLIARTKIESVYMESLPVIEYIMYTNSYPTKILRMHGNRQTTEYIDRY